MAILFCTYIVDIDFFYTEVFLIFKCLLISSILLFSKPLNLLNFLPYLFTCFKNNDSWSFARSTLSSCHCKHMSFAVKNYPVNPLFIPFSPPLSPPFFPLFSLFSPFFLPFLSPFPSLFSPLSPLFLSFSCFVKLCYY